MAIVKILSHGKSMASLRNALTYILNPQKTKSEICGILGDVQSVDVTPKAIYQEFLRVRKLFGKCCGNKSRTYTHGTVSWAGDEISAEDVLSFANEYLSQIYPEHQVVFAVHQDTANVHFHFLVNPVSFLDGSMLHWSKYDLEKAKQVCNEMCQNRGWNIAQKGQHYDGTMRAPGEVTAWNKNKYQKLKHKAKKSYLLDAAQAVMECLNNADSKEEFCQKLYHEYGWQVVWQDSKKHITFIDGQGNRVRDTNLYKTFQIEACKGKEALLAELEKNREKTIRNSEKNHRKKRGR